MDFFTSIHNSWLGVSGFGRDRLRLELDGTAPLAWTTGQANDAADPQRRSGLQKSPSRRLVSAGIGQDRIYHRLFVGAYLAVEPSKVCR
jgi:hypothetical protein